jgi:hypothetical protein
MCKKVAPTPSVWVLTVLVERHGSPQEIPSRSGRNAFESNGTSTAPIILTGIEVAVHTTHEQVHTPQANRFGSSTCGQPPHGKPHGLIVDIVDDDDIEDKVKEKLV